MKFKFKPTISGACARKTTLPCSNNGDCQSDASAPCSGGCTCSSSVAGWCHCRDVEVNSRKRADVVAAAAATLAKREVTFDMELQVWPRMPNARALFTV